MDVPQSQIGKLALQHAAGGSQRGVGRCRDGGSPRWQRSDGVTVHATMCHSHPHLLIADRGGQAQPRTGQQRLVHRGQRRVDVKLRGTWVVKMSLECAEFMYACVRAILLCLNCMWIGRDMANIETCN